VTDVRTVGWREWASLPDLGVRAVKAKLDTGARSSTLHVSTLEVVPSLRGPVVRFTVLPHQRDPSLAVRAQAPLAELREVPVRTGEVERRPVIRTRLAVAGSIYRIELSLTQRDDLGFRMVLGRRALRRRFLIDPERSFLGGGSTVAPPP
jgi:hypothetical protein